MGCSPSHPIVRTLTRHPLRGFEPPHPHDETNTAPVTRPREMMVLLDATGSMSWASSPTCKTRRRAVVRDALKLIVPEVGHEGAGIRTITFAAGRGTDVGELKAINIDEVFRSIEWRGTTSITPGWHTVLDVFRRGFGSLPPGDRPLLVCLLITDGEAKDHDEFQVAMAELPRDAYVLVAVIGYGTDYTTALDSFNAIAAEQPRVRVLPLGGEPSDVIAHALVTYAAAPVALTAWVPMDVTLQRSLSPTAARSSGSITTPTPMGGIPLSSVSIDA